MKKTALLILGIILVLVAGAAGYFKLLLPKVDPAPNIEIEVTPERIIRGKYLATHVAVCMDCHSTREWDQFSGPMKPGTEGKGGEYFGPEMGFPGEFFSKNLTPEHLGSWTDGEIFRAITSGVDKDGKALFPVMPYPYYGQLDKEDIYDIIAYLRSLPSIKNEVPESKAAFPINFLINTMPSKPVFIAKPDKKDSLLYGEYLVKMAACVDCHSPVDKGQVIVEKAFSGGREFELPGGTLRSTNLTPDLETGIGEWTAEKFVNQFKQYENGEYIYEVNEGDYNTLMPWSMYAGMDASDLKSIYYYLQSLPPIQNEVEKFTKR